MSKISLTVRWASYSDVDDYIINRELLDSTFNMGGKQNRHTEGLVEHKGLSLIRLPTQGEVYPLRSF